MKKIACCIGHNAKKKGFYSAFLDSTEYQYNTRVAEMLKQKMPSIDIYKRTHHSSYTNEIKELASRVNKKDYDLVFELHFNAFNGNVNGVEALYYHTSTNGKECAETFCEAIEMEYGVFNRGSKPLSKTNENGFGFVKYMKAPAIVVEPVFGDHRKALDFLNIDRYTDTLKKWLECLE